jgi:hypothetical protein
MTVGAAALTGAILAAPATAETPAGANVTPKAGEPVPCITVQNAPGGVLLYGHCPTAVTVKVEDASTPGKFGPCVSFAPNEYGPKDGDDGSFRDGKNPPIAC